MIRWGRNQKLNAGGMALTGGAIALFGIFEIGDGTLLDCLAAVLLGVGLLVGFGATYCLLDDPEEKDIFTLKVAARLGFLLVGLGAGLGFRLMEPDFPWQAVAVFVAIPLLSLAKLLVRRRREKRRKNEEKDPWEEP